MALGNRQSVRRVFAIWDPHPREENGERVPEVAKTQRVDVRRNGAATSQSIDSYPHLLSSLQSLWQHEMEEGNR